MAFFNLTYLGPQDPFKRAIAQSPSGEELTLCASCTSDDGGGGGGRDGEGEPAATQVTGATGGDGGSPALPTALEATTTAAQITGDTTTTPPPPTKDGDVELDLSYSHELYSHDTSAPPPHDFSYSKYCELLRKHQRDPQGPLDIYRYTLATSHDYGWWIKQGAPHIWSHAYRHAHVNSEMTSFVDDMTATNKDFSLF